MKIDRGRGHRRDLRRSAERCRRRHDGRPPQAGCVTPAVADRIAEATGIGGAQILEWVNHVDLMRIDGVGSEYSDLLEAAGVDSPAELAQRNAGQPRRRRSRRSSRPRPGIVRRVPSEAETPGLDRPVQEAAQGRRALGGGTRVGGFKEFLTKSNALALAIGVIIGASLGTVVDCARQRHHHAADRLGPGRRRLRRPQDRPRARTPAGEEVAIGWGLFLNAVIVFVVVALVVYLISKCSSRRPPAGPDAEETCSVICDEPQARRPPDGERARADRRPDRRPGRSVRPRRG